MDRKWTVQEDANWRVQKYIKWTVQTTESKQFKKGLELIDKG